jgi:glycosyltransferase involved in cell wall biosynthesis
MPFFSVIIPTYNRAHILLQTIESVQKQLFTNWECIVIDDGSTDNTAEVIKEISDHDKRIIYIHQQNAERSAARNNGIKNARGEYLCFLDSDDAFTELHLQELHLAITEKGMPNALFFTNYSIIQNGVKKEEIIPALTNNPIQYFFTNAVIPARVCISKNILNTENFDEDIVIVEDTVLWTRIALEYSIFHVQKSTVQYLLHDDNSISIKNTAFQKRLAGLKLFFKRYPEVAQKLSNQQIKKLLGDAYFGIAKHFIYKNEKWKAIEYLLISIAYLKMHNQLKHKTLLIFKLLTNKNIAEYQSQ